MNNLFLELTVVLIMAGAIAFLVSLLKQPSIVAYIITGLILGPFGYITLHQGDVFQTLSQFGVTLLLFMVGLQLDVRELKTIGKTALITGLGQVVFTTAIGFWILRLLHFSTTASLYIAPALTFSSTIIIVKLLSEKRDLQSLYGKIVVGVFLVQDFVAVFLLLALSSSSSQTSPIYAGLPAWQNIILTLVRALVLLLLVAFMSSKVFPKVINRIGKSEELLLIFSLAWAIGLAAFVSLPIMGFSLEIGGFLAGLALARSTVHFEIGARIKPLRDFFLIIFFIVLGSGLVFSNISQLTWPAIVLSAFVLIGNPIIVMVLLGLQGYKPRTGFFAGVTVAQVSEFSLILVALGLKLGHLTSADVGLVTLVAVVTISLSSYLIMFSAKIYNFLRAPLKFLDFKKGSAEKHLQTSELNNHIILVGVHRTGKHLAEALVRQKTPFVLVDFNPEIIEYYLSQNVPALCGDIADPYIQEEVNLSRARLIISTIPNLNDNLALIDAVKRSTKKRSRPKLIFLAQDEDEIKALYQMEIDYVISPHFMSGMHLAKLLKEDHNFRGLKKLRESHLKLLNI